LQLFAMAIRCSVPGTEGGATVAATPTQQRHVVAAAYLGWTLDAFDFFIMVFVLTDIAKEFGTSITAVTWAITLTLAMRALGAWIFGRIADRFGRRPTLMIDVLLYSILEFASGFAPSLTVFIILRALFGIAMGGEWGVGASLTMETIPPRWRGTVSGLLQAGYPSGYLLASIMYWVAYPHVGWRGLFMLGAVPALLVLYIRRSVPESPDWEQRAVAQQRAPIWQVLRRNVGLTIYAIIMMTAFNFFSHGTQDLYPTFLKVQHQLDTAQVSEIAIVYNIGAMLGGLAFGALSQRIGRRVAIVIAAVLAVPVIPLWVFSTTPMMLAVGAFLMQLFVQGAWGVIPVHLNELSPPEIRGTFPGVTYQLGNLLASANATIQSAIAASTGGNYALALAGTACIVAIAIALLVGIGKEAHNAQMGAQVAVSGD
jgi:SHS family lactate transporter-like MFS transporter